MTSCQTNIVGYRIHIFFSPPVLVSRCSDQTWGSAKAPLSPGSSSWQDSALSPRLPYPTVPAEPEFFLSWPSAEDYKTHSINRLAFSPYLACDITVWLDQYGKQNNTDIKLVSIQSLLFALAADTLSYCIVWWISLLLVCIVLEKGNIPFKLILHSFDLLQTWQLLMIRRWHRHLHTM